MGLSFGLEENPAFNHRIHIYVDLVND
jgi:hypothetical protein